MHQRFLNPRVGRRVLAWLIGLTATLLAISLILATAGAWLASREEGEPLTIAQSMTQAASTVLNYWTIGAVMAIAIMAAAAGIVLLRRRS